MSKGSARNGRRREWHWARRWLSLQNRATKVAGVYNRRRSGANMVIDSHSPDFTAPDNCAICNRPPSDGVRMRNSGVFDGLLIECPQCGRYELKGAQAISASFQWAPELRQALSCAARQAAEAEQPLQITGGNAAEFAEPHMHTRVSDNRDRLLREAAKRSGRPHIGAPFSLTNDFTLIDCYSQEEFVWYIECAKRVCIALRNLLPNFPVVSQCASPTSYSGLRIEKFARFEVLPDSLAL